MFYPQGPAGINRAVNDLKDVFKE